MLRYTVDDITCGHCVQTITKALEAADPQAEVTVDLASKQVEVTTVRTSSEIAQAIRDAGYTPVQAEASPSTTAPAGCCGHC